MQIRGNCGYNPFTKINSVVGIVGLEVKDIPANTFLPLSALFILLVTGI